MSPIALVEALNNVEYNDVRNKLREMLDKGILTLTPEGLLRLNR